ncbi:TetR/AcrR family transcriptional regulator [Azomonas macrocytogenes]|uniref:TetR/AcrR family transcriptional repressor of nem operon n=1 Tax=Azomonas macrocytogenes TaxID=69962 RepID=A0A839T341_AZOMA|nr:TetR/AcrR family transcriptional regulator [Azomonas macrocytogenes]MBB3103951.1 TetR/AcrR family transcriptional repressor of nem operon [Azomonas macrocytogenes]
MNTHGSLPRRGRPPKVSREYSDTREALIRIGTAVLTEQGFVATGLDGLLKQVDVPKGSFYHYFKSKDAFGRAVLESYAVYFARKLDRRLLDESMSPLERIGTFVEDAKAGMVKHQFRRGCLVGNLGQEVTVLPEGYGDLLEAIFASWQGRIAACLSLAQQSGDLSEKADCMELAQFFWIGWEGAVMRARLVQKVDPLDVFFKVFMAGLPR